MRGSRGFAASDDARRRARRRLPRIIFDFSDGAAGRESTRKRNAAALEDILLQPRVLQDISRRSLGTRFLGEDYGLPFGVAPMGMCNLSHPGADAALARCAASSGIPLCVSSAASTNLERMQELAEGRAWFQLYVGRSQEAALRLIERARAAGYEVLVLTVDVPQVGRRPRELRHGFRVPFRLGPRQALDFATHPRWSLAQRDLLLPVRDRRRRPGGQRHRARRDGAVPRRQDRGAGMAEVLTRPSASGHRSCGAAGAPPAAGIGSPQYQSPRRSCQIFSPIMQS